MTTEPTTRCTANLKTCPVTRGGCGYRYIKGDTKWQDGGVCPQCGFDRRCGNLSVNNHHVCRMHGIGSVNKGRVGGTNRKGDDLRYVFLPKEIARTYLKAKNDPDLRSFDRNLATQEAMILDAAHRMDTGESGEAWKSLAQELPEFIESLRSLCQSYQNAAHQIATQGMTPETRQAMADAINNIISAITGPKPDALIATVSKGRYAYAARDELREWEEQQRKTKESDMRQQKDLKAMVAIDQFLRFTEAVAIAIERRIDDPQLRNLLAMDVEQLLQLPAGLTVDSRAVEPKIPILED